MYHEGTNMHPLDTKVYLLKRYCPSDSFRTFFSESVGRAREISKKQPLIKLALDWFKHVLWVTL